MLYQEHNVSPCDRRIIIFITNKNPENTSVTFLLLIAGVGKHDLRRHHNKTYQYGCASGPSPDTTRELKK